MIYITDNITLSLFGKNSFFSYLFLNLLAEIDTNRIRPFLLIFLICSDCSFKLIHWLINLESIDLKLTAQQLCFSPFDFKRFKIILISRQTILNLLKSRKAEYVTSYLFLVANVFSHNSLLSLKTRIICDFQETCFHFLTCSISLIGCLIMVRIVLIV